MHQQNVSNAENAYVNNIYCGAPLLCGGRSGEAGLDCCHVHLESVGTDLVGGNHVVLHSRGMLTRSISSMAYYPGATEGVPGLNPISKPGEAEVSIVFESIYDRISGPASKVLECLRKIPVMQGDSGFYARLNQSIDQLVVVKYPFLRVVCPVARGENAGPGDGELVGVDMETPEQVDIIVHFVVTVTSQISRLILKDLVLMAKSIPDGLTLPMF